MLGVHELLLAVGSTWMAPADAPSATGDSALDIQWQAPASCPSEREFLGRVETHAGTPLAQLRQRPLKANARIERIGEQWVLTLQLTDEGITGERTLSDESCELLADAAALVIVFALDVMEATEQRLEAAPAPPAQPSPRAPETPSEPSSAVTGLLGAAGLVDAGMLPQVSGGLELSVGMAVALARIEGFGRYWFESPAQALEAPEAGVDVQAWAVGARACVRPAVRSIEIAVCLGGESGQLLGQGAGIDRARRAGVTWGALDLAAGFTWLPVRWFGVSVMVEGAIALARPAFAIENLGILHRPSAMAVRGFLGPQVRFP